MSASEILAEDSSDLVLPGERIKVNTDSQGPFDLCNNIDSLDCNETMSPTNKQTEHTQNCHKGNGEISTKEMAFDEGPYNVSINHTVSESEIPPKNRSLDFQAKNTVVGFSRTDNTRNGKRKTLTLMPKCRRQVPHYETDMVTHKLEFVEEENLSDQEVSSEEDNLENSFSYSRPHLDHRKERHQYVSDQLDPDVLHLLEMHLRKQQLVEIKEEREEELLDVHINKEKSRSESFKLLRNISPVLDMVLEEPELEHSGDALEEESKTPSDIDSDDSSNSCAVEMGLLESLQRDLMSKSNKIDQHEIATILQAPASVMSSRDNKNNQKAAVCDDNEDQTQCETIKMTEPQAPSDETGHSSNLHLVEMQMCDGNFTSGFDSQSAPAEIGYDLESQSDGSICDSCRELTEESVPCKETGADKDSMEERNLSYQCISSPSGNKDLNLDVNHEGVSDTGSHVTQTGTGLTECKGDALNESESDSEISEDISKEKCPNLHENLKLHDIIVNCENGITSLPSVSNGTGNNFTNHTEHVPKEVSAEQHDDVGGLQGGDDMEQPDLKAQLKSVNKENSSEPSAEMSTLRLDLEEKILSILEKAHAADCRSSHLQAGAELLWKESIELRNECKSLSKEAAELLAIFKKQSVVHRQSRRQITHGTKTIESLSTTDTKPSNKETLHFSSKGESRSMNKGEERLQFLSKKYDFIREEAPEIMRELNVLQQDLKSLPSYHSKPQLHHIRLFVEGIP
ncbi:hypothetical protein GDO81_003791 [Engystomops pustulosus]|uniref:Uncharacterized protein n=1 Tax=Engystomops pustulosus TaxID=76066 RepID=A0AAV7A674_ENGPU|nr:hypothetical protein GDO81_003791 [Engystomops pustulosus]